MAPSCGEDNDSAQHFESRSLGPWRCQGLRREPLPRGRGLRATRARGDPTACTSVQTAPAAESTARQGPGGFPRRRCKPPAREVCKLFAPRLKVLPTTPELLPLEAYFFVRSPWSPHVPAPILQVRFSQSLSRFVCAARIDSVASIRFVADALPLAQRHAIASRSGRLTYSHRGADRYHSPRLAENTLNSSLLRSGFVPPSELEALDMSAPTPVRSTRTPGKTPGRGALKEVTNSHTPSADAVGAPVAVKRRIRCSESR